MKLTKYTLLLLIILLSLGSTAQDYELTTKSKKAKKAFTEAYTCYKRRDNDGAIEKLKKAVGYDENFIEAWMMMGDVYSDMNMKEEAIEAYLKAVGINPDFFPRNFFNLGKIEVSLGKYAEAKEHYESYLSYPNTNPNLNSKIQYDLKICEFAIKAMLHPVPFEPLAMSTAINTFNGEYSPTLTIDEQTLIFTKLRPRDNMTVTSSEFEEDLYISHLVDGAWTDATFMGAPLNSHGNEGAQCISPDGKFLVYTACNRNEGYGSCDLYISKRVGDKWSQPQNMGPTVNSGMWDSQPSISPDGKEIYFASARDGGKGNMDIWMTSLQDDGVWGKPVNLTDSINTPNQEMTPFIHSDNKTLYFTSNGHIGMGELDIFYCKRNEDGNWGKPVNFGYPINTYKDEGFLIINAQGNKAYFASDKPGGQGKLDLYTFEVPEEARPQAVNYMKGKVFDKTTGQKLEARFELIDLETQEVVILSSSDPETGEFLVCLPTDKDYALNVSKGGYLFFSESFQMSGEHPQLDPYRKDIPLQPIETGKTVVLKNIFFDFDLYALKPESQAELSRLVSLLNENPAMKIEIGGHTDNKGSPEYNQKLSENRAGAVYQYLVDHGIDKKRLSFKGYGLTNPIDTNETEEGRANNRRTEFKVMEL